MARSARRLLAGVLCLSLALALGFEPRVHSGSLPMAGRAGETLAIAEARAAAMRDAARQGHAGESFLRAAHGRFLELVGSPRFTARSRGLAAEFQAAHRDSDGVPYLVGTDPYRWLRRARNFAERGGFGEERRDGREWNTRTGVAGLPADGNLQAGALGIAGRVARALRGPSLEHMAFWSPVFVFSLALVPAFLVGSRLGGLVAATLGAGTLALQPVLFQRTTAGYADTDAWNLLLSVLAFWLIVEAIHAASPGAHTGRTDRRPAEARVCPSGSGLEPRAGPAAAARGATASAPRAGPEVTPSKLESHGPWDLSGRTLALAGLGGAVLGVFAWSWPGWWFQGLVLAAGLAASLFAEAARVLVARLRGAHDRVSRSRLRSLAAVLAVLVLCTGVVAVAMGARASLASLWREPLSAMGMLARAGAEAWPNPYLTVGELQPTSFASLQESAGGIELLIGGALGIVVLLVAFRDPVRRTAGLVLAAWLVVALVASTRGSRFLVMHGPPLAIGWGVLLASLLRWGWTALGSGDHRHRPMRIAAFAVSALLALSSIVLMRLNDHRIAATEALVPEMNDAWDANFAWLRGHASPDAVVCAWWDFGDLVTARTGRRVLFDAGSQVSSTAYWIGRALAAEEPAQALGILRMLCLGGDRAAYQALRRTGLAPARAVSLLGEGARLDAARRGAMLAAADIDSGTAASVLAALAGEPPESYLWITEDLTWKAHAWGRYGRWDFRKAAFYDATRGLSPSQAVARAAFLGIGNEEAMILRAQIERLGSPWAVTEWIAPGVAVQRPVACVAHELGLVTERGLVVRGAPASGVVRSGDATAAIYERAGQSWIAQIPPALSRSLYIRLMYESPRGVPGFRLVHSATSITGERCALYRIEWP